LGHLKKKCKKKFLRVAKKKIEIFFCSTKIFWVSPVLDFILFRCAFWSRIARPGLKKIKMVFGYGKKKFFAQQKQKIWSMQKKFFVNAKKKKNCGCNFFFCGGVGPVLDFILFRNDFWLKIARKKIKKIKLVFEKKKKKIFFVFLYKKKERI